MICASIIDTRFAKTILIHIGHNLVKEAFEIYDMLLLVLFWK